MRSKHKQNAGPFSHAFQVFEIKYLKRNILEKNIFLTFLKMSYGFRAHKFQSNLPKYGESTIDGYRRQIFCRTPVTKQVLFMHLPIHSLALTEGNSLQIFDLRWINV